MNTVGGNRGNSAADKQGIRKEKRSGEAVCAEGSASMGWSSLSEKVKEVGHAPTVALQGARMNKTFLTLEKPKTRNELANKSLFLTNNKNKKGKY